ncbi:MAG: glycosyltransferase family 39 protein [Leptolyngbyaceae cyanobacterium HOT.MB2.61]|nr:glycosyltransferase family 39 protein [Leptolyngbyaceae cyanobacterium HOT.MB2.61]
MPFRLRLPLLIAFMLLRLVFWFNTFPNPDEAYYWLWGQHLDWSYYDHPPLQAWVQGLFTALFGRSNFVLRLPNLLSNIVFFYTYYRITHYLYGQNARHHFWVLVLLVLASPLYFLFLALAWHDHLLITFSLISAYLFIRFLDGYLADGRGESWRLYGAAGAIALAGLCKYSVVFVGLSFVAVMVADRRLRPLWGDRRIWRAGAIVAMALIPILFWNISNDFQSFRYYANRSVNTGDFHFKIGPFLNFVLFSFLTVSPVNWISFVYGLRMFFESDSYGGGEWGVGNGNETDCKQLTPPLVMKSVYPMVAFWVFIISTATLTTISLVSAALYYWNITAYLLLFPLASGSFLTSPQWEKNHRQGIQFGYARLLADSGLHLTRRRLFLTGQFLGLLFAGLLVIHYGFLPLSALLSKDEDPDSRMLFGWNQLAEAVAAEAASFGTDPLLIATDYRTASALAYQLNDKNVRVVSDRVDQFDFWDKDDAFFQSRNAVILSDSWHPVQSELLSQFERVSVATAIPVIRFGVWIKNYYITNGYGFKGRGNLPIPQVEGDGGLPPVLRTLTTLLNRSNQNGAPMAIAIPVTSHPINRRNNSMGLATMSWATTGTLVGASGPRQA